MAKDISIEFETAWDRKYWLYIGLLLMWPMQLFGRRAAGWWNDFILTRGGCKTRWTGQTEWKYVMDTKAMSTSSAARDTDASR